jgi:hypothetical protein
MNTDESQLTNRAQDSAHDLRTRISEASHTARAKTAEFATHTAAKAREIAGEFGHQIKQFGEKIREKSPHETVRATTNKVADSLENAGSYLEQKNLDGMLDDMAGLIRRYPLQSVLAGIAVGFFLGHKRRND